MFHMKQKFNYLYLIVMKINYKFQIQVKLEDLTIYLDRSFDLEISTFNHLSDFHEIENMVSDVKNLYFTYKNIPWELLAKDLDYVDLNFLLFLRTIEQSNFDDVRFTGDFVPLVGRHGKGFEFVFLVNEG